MWLLVVLAWCRVCAAGAEQPVLVVAAEAPAALLQEELAADRAWLAALPAALLRGPVVGAAGDTLDGWRRWLTTAAAGDSVSSVRDPASLLRDRWQLRGYLGARCWFAGGRGDTLYVDPGARYTVAALTVEGDDFPGREQLLRTWLPAPGDPFAPADLSTAIDHILIGAGEAGYPFARWVTREIALDPTAGTVDIAAGLLPGSRAWLGPISSNLPPGRGADFLVRSSGLQPGQPFRQSELAAAVQRLQIRDLYAAVDDPSVYLTTSVDTVGVHFEVVRRRKVNRLQVVLGLSRAAGDDPARLSGQVDLALPNMAGTGRSLQVGWRDDGADKSRFGFTYGEPLAFGTPLDMTVSLDHEVQREVYTRFRLDNRWLLPVVDLWGVEVGFGWDRSTFPVGDLASTRRWRARVAVQHRRGDRTRDGWHGVFALESARRTGALRTVADDDTTAVVTTSALGEAVSQRIFEVDLEGEVWLSRSWSLFGRTALRDLSGGDQDVPLSEQFRFGGATTLRGHREDAFHGTRAAWGGIELRIGRPDRSRLYTFYDLGYFRFSALDPVPEDAQRRTRTTGWPRGFGLGLLARTAAGDVSLAIGFPGSVDFDTAMLHVALLETF